MFSDDFSRAENDIGIWRRQSGRWQIRHTLDPNGVPEYYSYEALSEEDGIATAGSETWQDYRAGVSLKMTGDGRAGLIVCYSAGRYYLWQIVSDGAAEAQFCALNRGDSKLLFRQKGSIHHGFPRCFSNW